MADQQISDLAALTGANLATGDKLEVLDVSDTTMAAEGTNKAMTAAEAAAGLARLSNYGTFFRRVYQSLTDKTTWGAINTREQWGSEEATLDDALLPKLTDVTVYAPLRGAITNWTSNSLMRFRVEISLDGGSTWNQGADLWVRLDTAATADRIPLFVDHQVTGTVTGDIQARVMVETDIISPAEQLTQGKIAMEVLVAA